MEDPSFDGVWYLEGITWSGRQFVLSGVMRGQTPSGNDGMRFWSSPDGDTWTMSTERSWGAALAYAFDGSGAGVAVGSLGSNVAVWTTADGVRWTKLPDQPAFQPASGEREVGLFAVAHADVGYVAIGGGGSVTAFFSSDGRTWSRLPAQSFATVENPQIAAAGGRFVIAGTRRDADASHVALWTSVDGRTWTQRHNLESPPAELDELTAGPAGWLISEHVASSWVGRAWWSDDGLAWSEIAWIAPVAGTSAFQWGLTATPWGFVVGDRSEQVEPSPSSTPDPLASPAPTPDPLASPAPLSTEPPPPVTRICEWRGTEPWTCQAVRSGGFALSDDAIVILEEGDGGKAIWVAEVQP